MRLSSRHGLLIPFAWAAAAAAVGLGARPLQAQQRRTLDRGEPEAQVLGYYAALMSFLPVGLTDRGGRLAIGGSATYLPQPSVEDRTVSFGGTKTVSTDICTAFPRLTMGKAFGRFGAELAATLPASVCGDETTMFGAALGYRGPLSPSWDGMLRVSGYTGSVKAPITCNAGMIRNPNDQTCYGGSVSSDEIAPFAISANVIAAWRGWSERRIEPYVMAGVRYERVDFEANYARSQAQADSVLLADPTHAVPPLAIRERLRTTLSRVHLGAGATWAAGRLRLGAEIFYAPGALFTVSGSAGFLVGRSS